ncbi:hypothetical protein GCM10010349_59730 [Streptomyces flavofungini]|nr:hypothetical protein GCM10010349_59730 [Streptomyces flavofungini]
MPLYGATAFKRWLRAGSSRSAYRRVSARLDMRRVASPRITSRSDERELPRGIPDVTASCATLPNGAWRGGLRVRSAGWTGLVRLGD